MMRPSHMTAMRWLIRRISGNSEEIMMIDFALLRQVVEQAIDFALGPDIDAARRLIKDQDVACRQSATCR